MLLFLLSGLLLLRFADRQFLALLFQLPPRITRFEPIGRHPKSMQDAQAKTPALSRQREGDEGFHPLLQLALRPSSLQVRQLVSPELALEPQLAPPGQPAFAWKDTITQKIHTPFGPIQ